MGCREERRRASEGMTDRVGAWGRTQVPDVGGSQSRQVGEGGEEEDRQKKQLCDL